MDIVRLLDHYRYNIIDDKLSITILTYLAREGATPESELIKSTKVDNLVLKEKIRDLYKASLIRMVDDLTWSITDFAETILAKLGMTEIVSRYYIRKQPLEAYDISFMECRVWGRATLSI